MNEAAKLRFCRLFLLVPISPLLLKAQSLLELFLESSLNERLLPELPSRSFCSCTKPAVVAIYAGVQDAQSLKDQVGDCAPRADLNKATRSF